MKVKIVFSFVVFLAVILTACTPEATLTQPLAEPTATAMPSEAPAATTVPGKADLYEEILVTYPSRGVQVPAAVVLPDEDEYPLVVMAHGHGGGKDENIGFPAIAQALAAKGIATIRMDFPGCGASTEEFTLNTMPNMMEDVVNGIAYAVENFAVDENAIGIFGYSMGGRIALQLIAEGKDEFAAVVFLAPAADTDNLKMLFGGEENWQKMKAEAAASADGYVVYTTMYGQEQKLSVEWFEELEKYPGISLAEQASLVYDGPALVIYAVDDEAVAPVVSQKVADLFAAEVITTPEDGHSYGFYSDKRHILDMVANGTADFFAKNLLQK